MATTNGHPTAIDILLIGLGSIGSVYAYMLERSGRARVTAVARSNYDQYAKSGVKLVTEKFGVVEGWKPYRVVKSQAEALEGDAHYAFCLICTKCLPDVLPTSKLIAEAIASGRVGAWALIQNGLGVEEDLYAAVTDLNTPIVSGCAWLGVMTSRDGKVVNWLGQDTLVSGIYPPLKRRHSRKIQGNYDPTDIGNSCILLSTIQPKTRSKPIRYYSKTAYAKIT